MVNNTKCGSSWIYCISHGHHFTACSSNGRREAHARADTSLPHTACEDPDPPEDADTSRPRLQTSLLDRHRHNYSTVSPWPFRHHASGCNCYLQPSNNRNYKAFAPRDMSSVVVQYSSVLPHNLTMTMMSEKRPIE